MGIFLTKHISIINKKMQFLIHTLRLPKLHFKISQLLNMCWSLVREGEGVSERDRGRKIDLLVHLCMHSYVS